MIRTTALLFLLIAGACSGPVSNIKVAYRADCAVAPLYAARRDADSFRTRYGLYLKPVRPETIWDMYDGRTKVLGLALMPFDSDSAVLAALLNGEAQVGLLAPEPVLRARMADRPVHVLAPLQSKGDMLVAGPKLTAGNWQEFVAFLKARTRPVSVGYMGAASMAMLGFQQALEYEEVKSTRDSADRAATVRLVQFESWPALAVALQHGKVDAAVLTQPAAALAATVSGNRTIAELHDLPPSRFENRPATVIAASDSAVLKHGAAITRFLELMAVATHYANNRTRNTLAAVRGLGTSPVMESTALSNMGFSSLPDLAFKDGLWNWYFALKWQDVYTDSLQRYMNRDDWIGIPYDSTLAIPALDRAGSRIIK